LLTREDEIGALKSLEAKLSKAPGATLEMLVDGVFGAFKDDDEFQQVMLTLAPLYTETYNHETALIKNKETVFRAHTHSTYFSPTRHSITNIKLDELYSKSEKFFDYREKLKDIEAPTLIIVGEHDWICPLGTFPNVNSFMEAFAELTE
jgi:proline iminopeptidase